MKDTEFIQKQKKIINESITRIEREISQNRKYSDLGATDEDNTQEFEELEEKQALIKSGQKELAESKAALLKIENKTYGVCAKCSLAIERGRLKAYPAAKYCASHAKESK